MTATLYLPKDGKITLTIDEGDGTTGEIDMAPMFTALLEKAPTEVRELTNPVDFGTLEWTPGTRIYVDGKRLPMAQAAERVGAAVAEALRFFVNVYSK